MSILKGTIYITDDPNIIYNIPINSNTKVINMDEDDILVNTDAMLVGTCLLPPVEAKIAEVDGNEALYDSIYASHLLEPYQQQFISAMLSYLYKGGNLMIFLPEIGTTYTREKFIYHLFSRYGVHCGLVGHPNPQISNCYYDNRCIPLWLNLIYSVNVISATEYLLNYPVDATINNNMIINKLIDELNPYGNTINDKINYILRYHKLIHNNSNLRPAITSGRRE